MAAIIILAIVIAVAFVIQAVVLSALYRMMFENALRMKGIIGRLEQQTRSVLDTTYTILEDAEPKIHEITNNVAETKATVRASLAQAVEAWDEIASRARAQADRLHELVSRIVSKPRGIDLGHDAHAIADAVNEKQSSSRAAAAR